MAFLAVLLLAAQSLASAPLLSEIAAADRKADSLVDSIATADELVERQRDWRSAWLAGIGDLPETRTPLNAKEGPVVEGDGFTFQNVCFESLPGVYVIGHLALPHSPAFKPPYPVVLMPMGHSDAGILAPRYAAHLAMMAQAGFAAFSWDPISQGERRQCAVADDAKFGECASEHARLGTRGWLVGWNFARFRIWDGLRAADYVLSRAEVDPKRVGVCGTSGGGTMSAYLQALDARIKVAFPNCFISSVRAVFAARGCHDAEQFFWNQLNVGVNHAAILALGFPRVRLATGSRWADYFPHSGAVETFAVYSNLTVRLNASFTPWHFHCAGPHGLSLPTRLAQKDWMAYCLQGCPRPSPLPYYWSYSTGDHAGTNDPCSRAALPFPAAAAYYTPTHHVRDLPGFRSLFAILADRARELKAARTPKTRTELQALVRRRAGIRTRDELVWAGGVKPPYTPAFTWWYLKGPFGPQRENEAAMMSVLGRSVVGREAERLICEAITNDVRQVLRAEGPACIAAAHAYAAEPDLFAGLVLTNQPPSWTEQVLNPDFSSDSFATAVWGALEDYDWPDLLH